MNKTTLKLTGRSSLAIALLLAGGCIQRHPRPQTATTPVSAATPSVEPTTAPVATEDLGTVAPLPGVTKPPKPFIALPRSSRMANARPSTLLLEHASPDSPVPLSDYARQPIFSTADFHLRSSLSAAELQHRLGAPAQLADNEDPWFVYRLSFNREIWLHFAGPDNDRLLAADVIRSAEDGYIRDRIFPVK